MKLFNNIFPVKAQLSAWLLLLLVAATAVPFNVLHSHHEGNEYFIEDRSDIVQDDHNTCDHELHLAEEQEICFLCHFVFVPEFKTSTINYSGELHLNASRQYGLFYQPGVGIPSLGEVFNKGSPSS